MENIHLNMPLNYNASLPSVPTSNVEREEEELELPGVPDHQPQVDLKYWKSY